MRHWLGYLTGAFLTLAVVCPAELPAFSEGQPPTLTLRSSQYWRGINRLVYADSLLFAVYASGLKTFRPDEGFLRLDSVAQLPLQVAYTNVLKLTNELVLYNRDGRVGFVFVKYPDKPQALGEIDLGFEFLDLAYRSTCLYFACGYEGIRVFDARDREHPAFQTTLGQPAHVVSLAIRNDYLYAIDDYNGIFIYSLQDPRRPRFVNKLLFVHPLTKIIIADTLAYCAYSDSGTAVLSLRDPENPQVARIYHTATSITDLDTAGGYILATDLKHNFEVYHPDTAKRVTYLLRGSWIHAPLLVSDGSGQFLLTVDDRQVASVYRLRARWKQTLINELGEGGRFAGLALGDSTLFAVTGQDPLLRLKLTSDLRLDSLPQTTLPPRIDALSHLEDYLFLADNGNRLLWIAQFDSTGAIAPVRVLYLPAPASALDVDRRDDSTALLAAFTADTVYLFSLTWGDFAFQSVSAIPAFFSAFDGKVFHDRLYISNAKSRGLVYDVSVPSAPHLLANLDWPGRFYDFQVTGDTLYAAGTAGLVAYQLDNGMPSRILKAYRGESFFGIELRGGCIYCAAGGAGVLVLSDSLPDAFPVISRQPTPGVAFDLALIGNTLIVTDLYSLLVLDLGESDEPGNEPPLPARFGLAQNYPNPFNENTLIAVDIPDSVAPDRLELVIYNVLGQKARTLFAGPAQPGRHVFDWDGRDDSGRSLASGMYICRARLGGSEATRKMLFVK